MSLAQASGKTIASAVPWKSSSTSRAYSLPVFFEICRLTPVTTAATVTGCSLHSPSVAVVRVPNSSTSVAEPLERVARDEEAEHLLLLDQPLGLGPGRDVGQPSAPAAAGAVGLAEERRLAGLLLLLQQLRLAQHAVERLAELLRGGRPGRRSAPATIRDSSTRLLQSRRSIRSTKSASAVNGASCAARR